MTKDEAVKKLEDAGFEVQTYELPGGEGIVEEQSPGGHEPADEGSTVTLWIR
jgi:beta-lactam-binding protein with PASTA domain